MRVTTGPRTGSRMRRLLVRPWAALPGAGCGTRSARYPYGAGPIFHPAMECSRNPFQAFSLSWSRYHSATPCLTLRVSTVVELSPSMEAGSSVANSRIPCRDSFFSSFSALNVSRADRSMSSQTTAANRGSGFGEQVGQAPVAGDPGGRERLVRLAAAALFQVQAAGFHVPVVPGDVPAGRQPFAAAPDLPGQRRDRVLEFGGGGPGQDGDRDRLGGGVGPGGGDQRDWCRCWRTHSRSSLIASACCAFSAAAFFPVSTRILNLIFIPPGLSPSLRL